MLARDLTGERFGRLIVTYRLIGKHVKRSYCYICKCDCGNETVGYQYELLNGDTKSCGCFTRERAIETNTTHGLSKTRFYQTWRDMLERTTNLKNHAYKRYGGRGIKVCKDWLVFENFVKDMYESYLKHSNDFSEKETKIDRIDNDKGYYLENCKWSTNKEQCANRSSSVKILIKGIYLSPIQIAEKYNLTYSSITHRLSRKWKLPDLIKPMRKRRK
jgi:hypothetical protein